MAGAIGLGAAIDYLTSIGMDKIEKHGYEITEYAMQRLQEIDGIKIFGPLKNRLGVITFNLSDIHPHDVATILDSEGIAIRAGQHCVQPLTKWLGESSTCRASFYLYNTKSDVDALIEGLIKTKEYFEDVN